MSSTVGYEIRRVQENAEYRAALNLRYEVFCREQGVPESEERDGRDHEALHLIAIAEGEVVGAVFCVPDLSGALAQVRRSVRLHPSRGGGTRGALINIGVVEKMRSHGIAFAMASRSFLTMAQQGMRYAGYTLVLDDNWASRRTAECLGGRVTGNFVTYRKAL